MHHPVHCLVDGSVAAGHQNQIRPTIHGAARNLARVAGAAGGNGIHRDAPRVQQLDGALKRMASTSECARVRIIDKNSLPVGLDSTLIILEALLYRNDSRSCSRLGTEQNLRCGNSFKPRLSPRSCPGDPAVFSCWHWPIPPEFRWWVALTPSSFWLRC